MNSSSNSTGEPIFCQKISFVSLTEIFFTYIFLKFFYGKLILKNLSGFFIKEKEKPKKKSDLQVFEVYKGRILESSFLNSKKKKSVFDPPMTTK